MEKPIRAQVPRTCEYDGTGMLDTERGIRCPKCGHEVFDQEFDFFGSEDAAAPSETCRCPNCRGRAGSGA